MKITAKLTTVLITGILLAAMVCPVSAAATPAKVKGLKAKSNVTATTLSWKKSKGAKRYIIYMNQGNGYKVKKTVRKTACKIGNLVPNRTRAFKVCAVKGKGGKTVYGKPSKAVKTRTKVPAVKPSAESLAGKVNLSWKKVDGTTGYIIYRNGKLLKKVKKYSYSDTSGVTEKKYNYSVRAYRTFKKKNYYSAMSKKVSALKITHLPAPSVSVGTGKHNGDVFTLLTWNRISDATGYKIYRKQDDGQYSVIFFSKNLSFADTDVEDGKSYTYSVVPYRIVNGAVRTGIGRDYPVTVLGITAPETEFPENAAAEEPAIEAPSSAKAEDITYSSAKLSWSAVSDCHGYRVFNSKGNLIKETTNPYCTISNLEMGTSYTYSVKAFRNEKEGNAKSLAFSTKDVQPYNLTAIDITYTSALLKWSADSLADKYKVYNSNGKLLSEQKTTSYSVSGLTSLKSYTYKVSACKGNHEGKPVSVTFKTKGLAKPKLSVTTTAFSATLKWDSVEGAEHYEIYRKSYFGEDDEQRKKLADTTSTTYTDYNLVMDIYSSQYSWYEYTVYAVSEKAVSEGATVRKTTQMKRSKNESFFPVDKRMKLNYSGNGGSDRFTIYLGETWSESIRSGLAKYSSGNASYSRPEIYDAECNRIERDYCEKDWEKYEKLDVTAYCFDIGDYDNFLFVEVCKGQIINWVTNAPVFATFEGRDIKRGYCRKTSDFINNVYASFYQSECMTKAVWSLGYEKSAALIAGACANNCNYNLEAPLIAKNENRIGAHWINAARVIHGRKPLAYKTEIEGDGKTYGAQAWANTMRASDDCGHGVMPKGPLAGKTFTDRLSTDFCRIYPKYAPRGENVGTGIIGEAMLLVYNNSIGHLATIMDKDALYFGCGFGYGVHCEQFYWDRNNK